MKTAVFVDGDFFLKRHRKIYPGKASPHKVAKSLYTGVLDNIKNLNEKDKADMEPSRLYRIFFYDCPPLNKRGHNPVTKRAVDFGKTETAVFRCALHQELKGQRKVALRLGKLADKDMRWEIHPEKIKELLRGEIQISDLDESDVRPVVRQKGVDMRIGLDIAALSYRKLVDQIILISGDSDFVPAAKLARREGIDFILDPMWKNVPSDLHEHIDGLSSGWRKPRITQKEG